MVLLFSHGCFEMFFFSQGEEQVSFMLSVRSSQWHPGSPCGWLGNSIFRPAYWAYCLLFRYSSLPWTLMNFATRELGVSKLIASAAFRVFACELKLRHDASPASYSSGFTNSWRAVSSPTWISHVSTYLNISGMYAYISWSLSHYIRCMMYRIQKTMGYFDIMAQSGTHFGCHFFGHAYRDDIL